MVPRAIERVRRRYPDLRIDINILKIEEAIENSKLDAKIKTIYRGC
jgi:hypothetical protein